jgi:transposase
LIPVKLTRFRGRRTVWVQGVHDGQDKIALRSRVPSPDGGTGARRPYAEELATEFEPTAQSIRNWVAQSDRNAGRGDGGLTTAEREELNRLRRENRQLRVEREILSKAAAWFARETNAIPAKGSGS